MGNFINLPEVLIEAVIDYLGVQDSVLNLSTCNRILKQIIRSSKLFQSFLNVGCGQFSATPLMYAAIVADYEEVTRLLDLNADVNKKDNRGCTPLMYVSSRRNILPVSRDAAINVIQELLKKGPAVNVETSEQITALMMAVDRSTFYISDRYHNTNLKVILALIAAGANIHHNDPSFSPLQKAINLESDATQGSCTATSRSMLTLYEICSRNHEIVSGERQLMHENKRLSQIRKRSFSI